MHRRAPCRGPAAGVAAVLCYVCSFDGVDIALFSAGGSISKKLGPAAQKAGAVVSGQLGAGAGALRLHCGPVLYTESW